MANEEHLAILRQGVEAWNAWQEANPGLWPDFSEAYLSWVNLNEAILIGANFHRTHLSEAFLNGADLRKANLSETISRRANLSKADLSKADLSKANFSKANFSGAKLNGADLSGADLSGADLSKTHLSGADLSRTHLSGADLSEADLSKANFSGAKLSGADLSDADLSDADLSDADLSVATLSRAKLSGATLSGTNLSGTDLREIDLSGARLNRTVLTNVDLRTVTGLDQVKHRGPSPIGIDTLFLSQGQIPEFFLRGCGVPETLIKYLLSFIGTLQPIQYYSCFISYSGANEEFARRLHGRMQQAGLRVWFAPHDLKGGRKLYDQIDEAIRTYDKLIIVLSEASAASGWVETEIRRARRKERDRHTPVLFPIRLMAFDALQDWSLPDPDTGHDLAVDIRRYFIPDFSGWKDHDVFEAAFAKLLAALKSTTLSSGGLP